MKNYLKNGGLVTLGVAGVLGTSGANAAGVYDMITNAVNFADLTAALGVVYAGIVVVGIFMLGAQKITKKLGW